MGNEMKSGSSGGTSKCSMISMNDDVYGFEVE